MTGLGNRDVVERYLRAIPADYDALAKLRHPDFIEEWPQSGERIRGQDAHRQIHETYPGGTPRPDPIAIAGAADQWIVTASFTIMGVAGSGDEFTTVGLGSYPDGSTAYVVSILRLRDGKVGQGDDLLRPAVRATQVAGLLGGDHVRGRPKASPEMSPTGVRVIGPEDGESFDFRGAQILRKVSAVEATGRYTLTVGSQPPGFENSPHVHLHEPEAFFILEGDYQFHTAEGDVPAGPGSLVYIPPGELHGFRTGASGGRLIAISPAAFDGYFEEMRGLFAAGTDTPEAMAAVARAHDMKAYPATGQ